jgi:aspartyl-tRNA(Asn)/glutamyl-tRNA(Gln) amidotransferase subunit A
MDIGQAASSLRRKKLSPVELTQACLGRIEKLNCRLNSFVTLTTERALADARALEAESHQGKWRGPLHGIPVGLKDLYDTAGIRTTAGSRHWTDRVPSADAEVVRRLKAAGAVVLGKLNMDEFAYNFTGATSSFGTSRNPWNLERSPGGSSGGSAVAVAGGLCFAALGSDTGGSIRLPAAFCGITGLKPSYGAVSTAGVAPLAWSLDHVGPMCRSAADAALVLAALTGKPAGYGAVNVRRLRLGVPRMLFYADLDGHVQKLVAGATATLAKLGAGARDVTVPDLPMHRDVPVLPETYLRIIWAEAYTFHSEMLRTHPELYHPATRTTIENGTKVSAPEYIRARLEMDRLRAERGRWFAEADLLITPTAPGPAFALDATPLEFLRNTAPWNLLGFPTVSIPCGFTPAGLPVGLQITGAPGRDDAVLAMAAAYQKVTDWHQRRPPVA